MPLVGKEVGTPAQWCLLTIEMEKNSSSIADIELATATNKLIFKWIFNVGVIPLDFEMWNLLVRTWVGVIKIWALNTLLETMFTHCYIPGISSKRKFVTFHSQSVAILSSNPSQKDRQACFQNYCQTWRETELQSLESWDQLLHDTEHCHPYWW